MVVELRFRDWTSSGEQQLPQTMGENTAETHREWAERRHQQPPALCPMLHCAPFSLKHPGAPSKP